jgi:nucleoside-triphosphatase
MSVENLRNLTDSLLASLLFEKHSDRLLLLTGPSGSGKTTLCSQLVSSAREAGLLVGGILCPAVFEDGKKVAIDQLDISSGERQRLGVRSYGENTVGCWQLDERVIARGNQVIASLRDEDLIIIDELGPLELEEGYGYEQALPLLDEGRYHRAVVVVRPALLPLARVRWTAAQAVSVTGVPQ